MTGEEVLNLPMGENDAGAETIRDYLKALVHLVWRDDEGFDGKRPFGNSAWYYELFKPLVLAKVVKGKTEYENGELVDWECTEKTKARQLIHDAIEAL